MPSAQCADNLPTLPHHKVLRLLIANITIKQHDMQAPHAMVIAAGVLT
jgi:hypothetical protein